MNIPASDNIFFRFFGGGYGGGIKFNNRGKQGKLKEQEEIIRKKRFSQKLLYRNLVKSKYKILTDSMLHNKYKTIIQ